MKQEELEYILQLLEAEDVHVRIGLEYTLDEKTGEKTRRVIKDLF
jgi:hypothetical protein